MDKANVDEGDICEFLDEFMESKFNVMIEDDSSIEIAESLMSVK